MRTRTVAPVVALVVGLALTGTLTAQEPQQPAPQDTAAAQKLLPEVIKDVRMSPRVWENRQVLVQGVVERYATNPNPQAKNTRFFYFRDAWGDAILVRTSGQLPDLQVVYRIKGGVSLLAGQPYLVEDTREVDPYRTALTYGKTEARTGIMDRGALTGVGSAGSSNGSSSPVSGAGPNGSASKEAPHHPAPWSRPWYWLITASAFVLAGTFLWSSRRAKPAPEFLGLPHRSAPGAAAQAPEPGPGPTGDGAAIRAGVPVGQVVEDRTVRFFTPPPGTVKMLRGQFNVMVRKGIRSGCSPCLARRVGRK